VPLLSGALLSQACRYLVGIVFLMAAISKITNLREFEAQVLLHSGVPRLLAKILPGTDLQMSFTLARSLATFLPWLELICGLCLIFRWAVREAAAIASVLLSLFIAHWIAFRSEDCQCFFFPTVISAFPWWWHLLRDALFLLCSIYLAWRSLPQNPDSK
jgi:uncharacterized membrane protein YphA (DoxX/SURF4 family)